MDYGTIYRRRFELLRKAYARGKDADADAQAAFAEENRGWLPDYALFMALKRHFGMRPWTEWPDEEIRLRKNGAAEAYAEKLKDDVGFHTYLQFLFFRQWAALRAYAHENGIGIIGDIPIYVAMDSADVWAAPQWFRLDEKNVPTEVAGVPPDAFTADGQLWGNPLYRWDEMEKDGFGWWIRRIGGAEKLYDVLRIDHFRGLESYWAVPYGETTAKRGRWVKGPGIALVNALTGWFRDLRFIAEDLGYLTPEVHALLRESGLPGMKVLEFAFDTREASDYLPHTYPRNCVCYAGTHDNETLQQWKRSAAKADVAMARRYLGLNSAEGFNTGLLRGGMSSVADLFVAQIQDWLELGAEARINTPGVPDGNWQWRLTEGQLTEKLAEKIADMTKLYGRSCN